MSHKTIGRRPGADPERSPAHVEMDPSELGAVRAYQEAATAAARADRVDQLAARKADQVRADALAALAESQPGVADQLDAIEAHRAALQADPDADPDAGWPA